MLIADILSYDFVQRALVTGVLIAAACSSLGVFLVLRRLSLIGDGLAHVTFGSVAVVLLAGTLALAVEGDADVQRFVAVNPDPAESALGRPSNEALRGIFGGARVVAADETVAVEMCDHIVPLTQRNAGGFMSPLGPSTGKRISTS